MHIRSFSAQTISNRKVRFDGHEYLFPAGTYEVEIHRTYCGQTPYYEWWIKNENGICTRISRLDIYPVYNCLLQDVKQPGGA